MEVLQRTANRGSISTGYDIDNSLKFEADNSEYLSKTPSSAGNRKTWTLSAWVKRTELTTESNSAGNQNMILSAGNTYIQFDGNAIWVNFRAASENFFLATNRLFRDTSAWYHVVLQCDTTQGTASNRAKLWVNGVQETSFQNSTYDGMPLNYDTLMNSTNEHEVGKSTNEETTYANLFNGYMAEMHLVDGTALTPTSFGEFDDDSGIWKPKAYAGSHGTNGFYLDFKDASNLGNDASGGLDFTATNISAADQATDSPTNLFCTFNPLMTQNNPPTISEGAMKSTGGGGTWNQTWGNMGVKNGKWYYEFKVTNASSTGYFGASTTPAEGSNTTGASLMYNTSFMVGGAARIDYSYWQNGSQVANESTGWGTISTNDVIGIALDLDSATKTFTVYKNGTALSGTLSQPVDLPTNMQDEFIFPLYVQYENRQDEANFGGYTISSISSPASDSNNFGTFEYAPPTGYYALCSRNLSEFG
jgi:hypothetical protein